MTNLPDRSIPKQWKWKVNYHSFEHALVNYIVCQQLGGSPVRLYYSYAAAPDSALIRPYYFYGNVSQILESTVSGGVRIQQVNFTGVR